MAGTVIEYLQKYGDISFREKPLNDVDSLALCQLSYLKFDGMVSDVRHNGPSVTLREIAERPDVDKLFGDVRFEKENRALFEGMLSGRRFRDMKLNCYINLVEKEWETQFSATTFILDDGTLFLAFRGTDETIVGWKEDFNMAFQEAVPAQLLAQDYVREVAAEYVMPLRLGGHSKGGNLAVFAAARSTPDIQQRILEVYNNDGPGFTDYLMGDPGYLAMVPRIKTYVPQSSVIGMLLEHEEDYTVVDSSQQGLMQHDGFSWAVLGNRFVRLHSVTRQARLTDQELRGWVQGLTVEQREKFVDSAFQVLEASGAQTLTDLKADSFKAVRPMVRALKDLDKETREALLKFMSILFMSNLRMTLEGIQEETEKSLLRNGKKAERSAGKKG